MIYIKIAENAKKTPEKIALQFPGKSDVNYFELEKNISSTRNELLNLGIKLGDRVALVLANGAEMLTLCLSIMSFATVAPLNPKYKTAEFDFYLSDLKPEALVVAVGDDSPAIEVAKEKGIKIIRLNLETGNIFDESGKNKKTSSEVNNFFPLENDIALVLHTSGTTSRPKIVPLTQKNLFISASNTLKTLHLGPDDKCLNVMPLFHIHSFVVSLATLISGGTLICPREFVSGEFFNWLLQYRATWYTAAPTIHQAVLKEAKNNKNILEKISLKKIRSSSSPLSKEVIFDLEETFKAPVLESYGMTEAALQITSNQIFPGKRKAGSAGIADGPSLKIVNEEGQELLTGEIGEILIKGENVITSYENNPEANENSFIDGWFRTGDLGYLDSDSYLFITGRSKEMINKGGEKISPREIDEIIMRHEAVYQAVSFSVPHPSLGEEVGVAIILEKNYRTSKEEIQNFAKESLADFKIPQLIIFVDEIPKGPTGKLQRIGLYNKLENMINSEKNNLSNLSGINQTEELLLKIWQEILEIENLSVEDNFFEMGGDSLRIKELICQAEKAGLKIGAEDVLSYPSVRSLASIIQTT